MKRLSRRQFLTSTSAAALLAAKPAATPGPPALAQAEPETLAQLRSHFLNPSPDARPMTRWWWFGGASTPEEITRELEMMRDAGLGGIELQPVYPLEIDNPKLGIRNTRYFSPEWFGLLRHTLQETKRLGMQFDFTLASGWPYGGPYVPPALAAQKIGVLILDAAGPREFSWELYPYLAGVGRIFAIVAAPTLASGEADLRQARVISPGEEKRSGGGERGGQFRWNAPAGAWRVFIFTESLTHQLVKRPTIGMEGYVIDHFDRRALDLHLQALGDRTLRELAPLANPPFTSVFSDSLEVFGADWTPRFMEEFRERRGYDLTPYLPALWQESGPLTPHVRYDYHLTLSDLILGNYFAPLGEWAKQHGMTARIQAHGAMGDVMKGYALADIPEGEEGQFADRYSVIINHRRLASSAAHIYKKPVVSCESYTWLRFPLYTVTLEMMKGATDSSFLDGINTIVNQGYSYSPPQEGTPGWVWYASTMVNHNNIWWRHYKHLARYIRHCTAVLLQGVSVNPIGVYVPLADIYAHYNLGGLIMDEEIERRLGVELFNGLRQAGYDFDLINDDALERLAKVENQKLVAGTAEYSVIVVPRVRYMPPESLDELAEFAHQGGTLIFIERLPEAAPGVKDQASRSARLRETLSSLGLGYSDPAAAPSSPLAPVAKPGAVFLKNQAELVAYVKTVLAPDFSIVAPGTSTPEARRRAVENVGFAHRRTAEADIYFISNISSYAQVLRVQFNVGHRAPERWNPENASIDETVPFQYVESEGRKMTEVQLHLDPQDSCFLVFASSDEPIVTRTDVPGPLLVKRSGNKWQVQRVVLESGEYWIADGKNRKHRFAARVVPSPKPVSGPWKLVLGDRPPVHLIELKSWTELPEGASFSGWGTYSCSFDFESSSDDVDWLLDLGEVHETAEASLNGMELGAAWKGVRRLPCGPALRTGRNDLIVQVGNLWIQAVQSHPAPDYEAVAQTFGIRWGTYGERSHVHTPPSGLLGPVRLIAQKRFTVTI
jgi:hypothetical protein